MRLTVRDVARALHVNEKTIYRWIGQGILPSYRINNQYRFNSAEILEWATSRRINVSPDLLTEPDSLAAPLPTFHSALEAGGIHYRVEGGDRVAVLRAMVQLLKLPDDVNRDSLLQILLAREQLGSTAIGDGIAIPHVRNPIVLYVNRPEISLCFLEKPVDFGALDGKPVSVLFTLITPTIRTHLHLLSRLTFMLRDGAFKSALTRQGSREEILTAAHKAESLLVPAVEKAE